MAVEAEYSTVPTRFEAAAAVAVVAGSGSRIHQVMSKDGWKGRSFHFFVAKQDAVAASCLANLHFVIGEDSPALDAKLFRRSLANFAAFHLATIALSHWQLFALVVELYCGQH